MDFNTLFHGFNDKKVLVVGDAMIDAYMWGEINRMSPEAPVPVVEVKKHENRLGGAANVALNLKALGADPILCSVIGTGKRGMLFKELMIESKLSNEGILFTDKRKTTIKTRVIAEKKHQLRIDEEETKPILQEKEFLKLTLSLLNNIDVIILQDYNKGVLTSEIIEGIISTANKKEIPTIVDPKNFNFNSYINCTIFKPNLSEIKAGMGIDFNNNNINEIEKSTCNLRNKISAKGVLLTLSEGGICVNSEKEFKHIPAIKRNIIDVSGAGDTVISVASLCLASNLDYTILSGLSNLAGGLVCEEVGVIPINKEKLLEQALKTLVNE